MKTTYAVRCGCGLETRLRTLAREAFCPSCNWPLVYASSERVMCLSHHASLTITRSDART